MYAHGTGKGKLVLRFSRSYVDTICTWVLYICHDY